MVGGGWVSVFTPFVLVYNDVPPTHSSLLISASPNAQRSASHKSSLIVLVVTTCPPNLLEMVQINHMSIHV